MSYGTEKVSFFSSRSGNVRERFRGNPWEILKGEERQAILLSLANGPHLLTDIQRELGLDKKLLKKELRVLRNAKIVREKEGRWQPTFVILTERATVFLASLLEPMIDKIATDLSASIGDLRQSYEKTKVADHHIWDDFAHIFVDALILDFSMLGCVDFTSIGSSFYNLWSKEQCQTPFFGLEMGPRQVMTGVNSYQIGSYGLSLMHSTLFNRRLSTNEINEIIRDKTVKEALTKCLNRGSENLATPEILSKIGWISETNHQPRLSIPFLNDDDKKTLTTIGLEVGHRAGEIVAEDLDIIVQAFDRMGFNNWLEGIGDFATIALHLPLALVPAKLVRKGFLPRIPKDAPMTWGVWAWTGSWTLDFHVLAKHRLEEVEKALSQLKPEGQRKKKKHLLQAKFLFEDNKPAESLKALQSILLPSRA